MDSSVFPIELWSHVFQSFSTAHDATVSSQEAWAKIVTSNPRHRYRPTRTVFECNEAKRALGLVCRTFYELSRPVVLETISLWTAASLQYLARQIEERPELARTVGRCTKRIDFNFDLEGVGLDHGRGIFEDANLVLKSCRNLTFLLLPDWGPRTPQINPSEHALVEVIRLHDDPQALAEFASNLGGFANLRVLDLSMIPEPNIEGGTKPPSRLPLVHTVIGSLNVMCFHLRETELPSLRTYVFNRPSGLPTFDFLRFVREENTKNVESVDSTGCTTGLGFGLWNPVLFPLARELVLDLTDGASFNCTWTHLQSLGITGAVEGGGDVKVDLILRKLEVIESGRENGNYPSLRTVRILEDKTVRVLRERHAEEARLLETRLRALSVRVEDGDGNSLTSLPF